MIEFIGAILLAIILTVSGIGLGALLRLDPNDKEKV